MLTIAYVNPTFDFSITVLLKKLSLAWPTLSVLISSHVLSFGLYLLCFLYLGFPSIAELAEIFFFLTFLGCSHILLSFSPFFTCLVLESDSFESSSLRLTGVSHLILRITLKGRYYGPHFTDEKTEAKRNN